MSQEAKHSRISRALLSELIAGKYSPAGRLPSEAQLVRRFKVSRPTVARALRDLQEQGLIERRVGSGTYLRPATSARTAVGDRQFGVMIPGLGTTEIFESICGELAGLARVQDYGLLWGCDSQPKTGQHVSVAEVEAWCDQFIQRQVSGVFFAPFEHIQNGRDVNTRLAERLRRAGITVILLDRDLGRFPSRSDFDLVCIDNFSAGYVIAEHLLKLGSKRLAFIARPQSAPTIGSRIAGAREAILDRGMTVPKNFIQLGDPEDKAFIESILETDLDGAICGNDQTAAVLMRSLERRGLRVPRDVRIVGFDDVRLATLVSVPLTTVHQPVREIAVTAYRAMLDRIADPSLPARRFVLKANLVVRESCGAYVAGSSATTAETNAD